MSVRMARLGDVCARISDGTHQAPNWAASGVPFLFVSNIRNGTISFETSKFVSRVEYEKLTKNCPIEAGDVLYTAVGSYGNSAVVPSGKTFVFQRHIAHLKPRHDLIDATYLSQMLEAPPVRRQADKLARGVAQKTVTLSSLRDFEIPLPPLYEQKRIAAILDKADQLRQKRRQAIVLLDSFTQSIFLEMFGDPASNPRGWEVQSFGDVVKNENYRRIPVKSSDREQQSGTYPYYGASGIIDYVERPIFAGRHLLISEDGANLLSRSTDIAFIADGEFWVNNHAHVVSDNGRCNLIYLQALFTLTNLEPFVTGSAQPKLNRSKLDSIPIIAPRRNLQDEFEKRVNVRNDVRAAASLSAVTIEQSFASLQHRAFSGQL